MNYKLKYNLSIVALFIVITLFRIGVQFDNKIKFLEGENTILISSLTRTIITMDYMQQFKELYNKPPTMLWPMMLEDYKYMSSYKGIRDIPKTLYTGGSLTREHDGVDIVGEKIKIDGIEGARIINVYDGVVIDHYLPPGWHNGKLYTGDPELGGKVVILHDNGFTSVSGHMDWTNVHIGQRIPAGYVIGRQGNSGMSTGPHLHFELYDENMKLLQPLFYIKDPNDV